MSSPILCPECKIAHVDVRCPRASKLCVNGRKAHADGDNHYVSSPSRVLCAECLDHIGAKLAGMVAGLKAREEAEKELGAVMDGALRIEDYTHAPMARLILTAGEFGRCEGEDTYHEVANVVVSARQPEAEARRMAAIFALAPRMAEALRALIVAVEAANATDMRLLTLGVADDARAILRKLDGGTR